MSRPTTSEDRAFYYPDKKLADDDHRRMFEAEAAAIERDRARRKRYLSNHLSIDPITIRRAKP